jgi:OOP family OmpA-OmpF porin
VGARHEGAAVVPEPRERDQLERLRALLTGPERERLEQLEARLGRALEPAAVAETLPEAVALRSARDDGLARALGPTIERGLEEQITRNPGRVAEAIYPVLGPAIRRAISDALAGFAETINRAIEHSLSWRGLRWRLEAWRTGVPFAQVVLRRALVYRVEQVLLVHATTGLPLAHASVSAEAARDSDLVSGMLTAIRDFVGDSFEPAQGNELRGATVGDVTLHVETGPRAMLAVAVRGLAPVELRRTWQSVLELVHYRFAAELAAFEGDARPFEPARPLLEGCLETVLHTDRPEGRSRTPRLVWSFAVLLLLLALAFGVRGHLRWRALVGDVDALPGVVVLDATRSPWRVSIDGFRDPLAPDPDALLVARGVAADRLRARWLGFVSTEPEIALERARRVLAAPASVTFELESSDPTSQEGGATLRAAGTAPAEWLEAAERASPLLPGVARLDLSRVAAGHPDELRAAAEALAARRVLFAVGASTLDESARREVEAAARALVDLDRLAREAGYRAEVEIVGRTDEAGPRDVNQRLSLARAEAVRDALYAAGVPGDRPLAVRGVGSEAPRADGASAQSDRSASFAARFLADALP